MPDAEDDMDVTQLEVDSLFQRQARRATVVGAIAFVLGAGLFIVASRLASDSIPQSVVSWLGIFGIFGGFSLGVGSAIRIGYLRRRHPDRRDQLHEVGVQEIGKDDPDRRREHDHPAEDSE